MARKPTKTPAPKVKPLKVKRPMRADAGTRTDGWTNILTGMGVTGKDKRLGNKFQVDPMAREDQEALWRGDDMAAKAVEILPTEMLRQGYEITIAGGEGQSEGDHEAALEQEREAEEGAGVSLAGDPRTNSDGFPPGGGAPPPAPGPMLPPPPPKVPGPIDTSAQADAKQQAEMVEAKLQELNTKAKLKEALMYERAYGGSAILIGADDGEQDLSKPLKLDAIKSVTFLTVLTPRELYPVAYYANYRKPKFGEVAIYRLQPETIPVDVSARKNAPTSGSLLPEIHESRLIIFPGICVSRLQRRAQNSWGDSVFVRIQSVLADFQAAWGATGVLLHDFSQAVISIKGLMDLIQANDTDSDGVVIKRAQLIELCRSTFRAVIIDSEETYTRQQTPVTGLPELLDKFALRLAAAMDIPVSRLMGQSPAGLNATGESDHDFLQNTVKGQQEEKLRPPLERLTRIVMLAKDGPCAGEEPDNWSLVFNPLTQETETEQANNRKTQMETDTGYITAQVVTPEEIAASRFGGDKYSFDTTIDFETRDKMAVETEKAQAEHEKAKAKALKNPPTPAVPPNGNPPKPPTAPAA